jgi:Bor protein
MAVSLRRKLLVTTALGCMVTLGACYHTITTTNLNPGPVHVQQWVPTFIYGLVPGNVDAAKMCAGKGVQAVDSQASFLNVLVGAVTFGIFTPMQVTVTCAG